MICTKAFRFPDNLRAESFSNISGMITLDTRTKSEVYVMFVVRRQYYVFHNFCLSSCVYCVILPPLSQNDQYYLEALGKTWDSCSSYDRIILAGVLNFEELETCMELSFIRTINYQKYLFNKDSPNPLTITINLFLINNSTYLQNKITFYWCLWFS